MSKTLIGFIPNLEESKQIVIAKWKTMEEAIKFAKEMYGFDWDTMEKAKSRENTWIWIMKTINISSIY